MPFTAVEVEPKRTAVPTVLMSYMRSLLQGKKKIKSAGALHAPGAKPELRITVPTVICSISKKKQFQLEIGTGADHRKARIVGTNAANKHTVEPKELKNCWVFRFGFVPSLGTDIWDDERVLVRKINDDTFEFDLPECWESSKTK